MKTKLPVDLFALTGVFVVFAVSPSIATALALTGSFAFTGFTQWQNRENHSLSTRLESAENSVVLLTKTLTLNSSILESIKSEMAFLKLNTSRNSSINPNPFNGNMRNPQNG